MASALRGVYPSVICVTLLVAPGLVTAGVREALDAGVQTATASVPPVDAAPDRSPRTVWDGVYTVEQALRGQQSYKRSCAYCHLDNLRGDGSAPALSGDTFLTQWDRRSVDELIAVVADTMPQDAPGTLSAQTSAAIVSYIFKTNEMPSGEIELPVDSEQLRQILITKK
jgi:S-disulfanyl-L-cysteine oxidoreductase SoxD